MTITPAVQHALEHDNGPMSNRKLTLISDLSPAPSPERPLKVYPGKGRPEFSLQLQGAYSESCVVTYPGKIDVGYDANGNMLFISAPKGSDAEISWVTLHLRHFPEKVTKQDFWEGLGENAILVKKGTVIQEAYTGYDHEHSSLKLG